MFGLSSEEENGISVRQGQRDGSRPDYETLNVLMGGWAGRWLGLGARHSAQRSLACAMGTGGRESGWKVMQLLSKRFQEQTLKLCEWMSGPRKLCEVPSIYATNRTVRQGRRRPEGRTVGTEERLTKTQLFSYSDNNLEV